MMPYLAAVSVVYFSSLNVVIMIEVLGSEQRGFSGMVRCVVLVEDERLLI